MTKLLKPSIKWNGKTVALDDGHGMETPGKRTPYVPELGRQIKENEFNRSVVAILADLLLANGFRVLLVAPKDTDTPLSYRTKAANDYGANIYVSIHYNAMGTSFNYSSASGISVHIYDGWITDTTKRLAECVGKYLRRGTQQVYRGIKRNNFHVLREFRGPAILTENGFMDDHREALLMLEESYQREVAIEHAQGICEYYGMTYRGDQVNTNPMDKGYLMTGDQGDAVKALQRLLKQIGYSLAIDGSFGPATEKAIRGFQRAHNLNVDGYYGPYTQKVLSEAVKRYTSKSKEEKHMEKNIFICNAPTDAVSAHKAVVRNEGVIKFRANAEKDKVFAENAIYVIGGGKSGIKVGAGKVVDLSGKNAEETAHNVAEHFKLL